MPPQRPPQLQHPPQLPPPLHHLLTADLARPPARAAPPRLRQGAVREAADTRLRRPPQLPLPLHRQRTVDLGRPPVQAAPPCPRRAPTAGAVRVAVDTRLRCPPQLQHPPQPPPHLHRPLTADLARPPDQAAPPGLHQVPTAAAGREAVDTPLRHPPLRHPPPSPSPLSRLLTPALGPLPAPAVWLPQEATEVAAAEATPHQHTEGREVTVGTAVRTAPRPLRLLHRHPHQPL